MMVNNSTNKTNNHLSPTERLNNDGQQFHQYEQSKQSFFTLNIFDCHTKQTRQMDKTQVVNL